MDFVHYLVTNIPLFSITLVMLFLAIKNLPVRRRESIYFIVFTSIVLILSVVVELETSSINKGYVVLGTIMSSLGYLLRPVLLYLFVLLANKGYRRKKIFFIALPIPVFICALIYLFPLFFGVPGLSTFVFSYTLNDAGQLDFHRGGFFNFMSHIACGIYLAVLTYVAIKKTRGKHHRDGIILLLCVGIVSTTTVIEMVFNRSDLLNIVCDICAMINYIFIISTESAKDSLTGLLDKRMFYEDTLRYKKRINGIIQIDMNGLKTINDTKGHLRGDIALKELAGIFLQATDPNTMCCYRMSGDEFIILMFNGTEKTLKEAAELIEVRVKGTNYSVAIGYYFYNPKDGETTFMDAMKITEDLMYFNKKEYYDRTGYTR